MRSFDIIIIGNGILALSTAHALSLQDSSLSIAIVGPSLRTGAATTAAGAMLGCFGEVTKHTYQSDLGLKKLDLAYKAKLMWPEWLASINEHAPLKEKIEIRNGTFIISNAKSGKVDDENYQAIRNALISYHEPFEEVDPQEIPFINPILDCRPLRVRYLHNEGHINPNKLLIGMEKIFNLNNKILYIHDEVLKINLRDNQVHSISIKNNNDLRSNNIVLAAGSFSQTLIDQIPELNFKIPRILSGVGCSLILDKPNHNFDKVVRSTNRAGACGIHALGIDKDSIFIGASNYVNFSAKINNKVRYAYYLLQYALEQIDQNLHDADILNWQLGCRPVTFDTFPLFGETSVKGLRVLSGTYRDGILLSPLLATEMAKDILGQKIESAITNFPVERLPLITMTKQQSIDQFINESIASAYEHSMRLPRNGWDDQLLCLIRMQVENLYMQLDTNLGLPAEIILMLQRDTSLVPYVKKYLKLIEDNQRQNSLV